MNPRAADAADGLPADRALRERLAEALGQVGAPASAAVSGVPMPSRRNHVFRAALPDGRGVTVKLFRYPDAHREFEVLSRLRGAGVDAPAPLAFGEDWLVCELVDGPTLMDLVNEGERDHLLADGLPRWLAVFHRAMADGPHRRVKGDCNLRNFRAVPEGGVVGVDFDGCAYGESAEDVAQACASLLASHPPFTPHKLSLSRLLVAAYREASGDAVDGVDALCARGLIELSKWRPRDREWLWRWAIQVEVWGLDDLAQQALRG